MTVSDLMVLAPWVVFALGLAVIGLVLLRSHRASRPRRPHPFREVPSIGRRPAVLTHSGGRH